MNDQAQQVSQAIAALLPLIGTGGLTTIVVAIIGYRLQKAKGPEKVKETLGLGPVKAADIELAVNAISTLSGAVLRSSLVAEFKLFKEGRQDEFEKWIEDREMHAALVAFNAQRRRDAKQAEN